MMQYALLALFIGVIAIGGFTFLGDDIRAMLSPDFSGQGHDLFRLLENDPGKITLVGDPWKPSETVINGNHMGVMVNDNGNVTFYLPQGEDFGTVTTSANGVEALNQSLNNIIETRHVTNMEEPLPEDFNLALLEQLSAQGMALSAYINGLLNSNNPPNLNELLTLVNNYMVQFNSLATYSQETYPNNPTVQALLNQVATVAALVSASAIDVGNHFNGEYNFVSGNNNYFDETRVIGAVYTPTEPLEGTHMTFGAE